MELTPNIAPEEIELLASAEIDGEFSAVAAGLGRDPAELRRVLADTDFAATVERFRGVRRELAGPPPPPLEDLERLRLRTRAMDAIASGSPSSRWPHIAWIAAAAVVVIGVGSGIFAVARSSDESPGMPAASKSTKAPGSSVRDLGDLGDVSDPASIKAALSPPGRVRSGARYSDASTTASPPAAPEGAEAVEPTVADASRDPRDCTAPLTTAVGDPGTLTAVATGESEGVAVVILAFTRNSQTEVWVLNAQDCSVRASQSF